MTNTWSVIYQFLHSIDHFVILLFSIPFAQSSLGVSFFIGTKLFLLSFVLGIAMIRTKRQKPSSGYNLIRDTVFVILGALVFISFLFNSGALIVGCFIGSILLVFLLMGLLDKRINKFVNIFFICFLGLSTAPSGREHRLPEYQKTVETEHKEDRYEQA